MANMKFDTLADHVVAPDYMAMTAKAFEDLRDETTKMVEQTRRDMQETGWREVHPVGERISAGTDEGDDTNEKGKEAGPDAEKGRRKTKAKGHRGSAGGG